MITDHGPVRWLKWPRRKHLLQHPSTSMRVLVPVGERILDLQRSATSGLPAEYAINTSTSSLFLASLLPPYPWNSHRSSSSASSRRWCARQKTDRLALKAKVQGLKSRAAFKLLEVRYEEVFPAKRMLVSNTWMKINEKYRLFRSGQVVVDLVHRNNVCFYDS